MDCSHQTWAGGGPAEIVAEDVAGVLMSSEGEGCMQTTDRAEKWLIGCRDPSRGESNPRGSALQQVQWQANALRYRGRSIHCYTP